MKANSHLGMLFTALNQVVIIYYSSLSYLLNILPANALFLLMQATCFDDSIAFILNTNQNSKIFTVTYPCLHASESNFSCLVFT